MKTTDKQCFSNGTEFMLWQDNNCCHCVKAVWYNVKRGTYPQYRCAVQRDIEMQAGGANEVTLRSYNATQNAKCPYLSTEREKCNRTPENGENGVLFDAHDFAKGKSLVSHPQEMHDYDNANDEEPVTPVQVVTSNPAHSFQHPKRVDIGDKIKKDAETMLNTFTLQENMMIAFIPLIISHIVWIYTEKVLKYCSANRISDFKKLCRDVKALRQLYYNDMRSYLDDNHIKKIELQTEEFVNTHSHDFNILWWQINGIIKLANPDILHDVMLTDVEFALFIIKALAEHNNKFNNLVQSRIDGAGRTSISPIILDLAQLLRRYIPKGFSFVENSQTELCKLIFNKNLLNIEFAVEA